MIANHADTARRVRACVIDREDGAGAQYLERPAAERGLQVLTPPQLADIHPDTEAVYVRASYWTDIDELLRLAPKLKWVQLSMVGYDRLLTPAFRESGVTLTNARGVLDDAIAEFVVGGTLLWSKGLLTSTLDSRAHSSHYRQLLGNAELRALVLGAGSIGSAVARHLRGIGVPRVDGVRRTVPPDAEVAAGPFDRVLTFAQLGQVVDIADYSVVVAVLPSSPTTRGIIDSALLDGLSERVVFINVGRGDTVDNIALARVMAQRPGSAAVLDVTAPEPLPEDHPLFAQPNVVISPHMSGDTRDRHRGFAELFLDNLARYTAGEPLRNVVETSAP